MKRTLTNEQMHNSVAALQQLEEEGAFGLIIAKNLDKLRNEVKEYEKARNDLIEKYGHKRPDGITEVSPENIHDFNDALAEISALESDVEVCTVSKDVFTGGKVTSKQMTPLLWMIEEEAEEPEEAVAEEIEKAGERHENAGV